MPQLDVTTFFSQFFWFCLSFITFYLFLLHYILPFIALNLKFRKEILGLLSNDVNKKKDDFSVFEIYDNSMWLVLNFFRSYALKVLNAINLWLFLNVEKTSYDFFFDANKKFLKVLTEKNLVQSVLNGKLRTFSSK